jgi:hypothetical protein
LVFFVRIFLTFAAAVVESILHVDIKDKFNFARLLLVFIAAEVKAGTTDALCCRVSIIGVELQATGHDLRQLLKLQFIYTLIQLIFRIDEDVLL